MSENVEAVRIQLEDFSQDEEIRALKASSLRMGGIATFLGCARDFSEGREVSEISFDAYPGLKVRGHVLTIGAGTGSEFSVLPAQNATGNWVKVTQRVPVRIAIDEKSPRQLIAGLSADIEVDLEAQPRK